MKWERFSQLQQKEVINICDGKRLGFVCDLEIDTERGKICSLIIPEEGGKWNLFCKERDYIVPYDCIKRIGDDTILVEICAQDCLEELE